MKIYSYRISELDSLLSSDKYAGSSCLPVSPERVVSYKNNPRAETDMPVLFTMETGGRIIGYRSLLPDSFNGRNERVSFAWLSGNYVVPEFRREGVSLELFREVENAWNGRLMYTNYAPASKAVYDKTDSFFLYSTRMGARYYMRSSMLSLLSGRVSSNALLRLSDRLINSVHDTFIRNMEFALPDGVSVSRITSLDAPVKEFIKKENASSLFSRNIKELIWIKDHPWISTDPSLSLKGRYHFTHIVDKFQNIWYRIDKKSALGFVWIKIVNDRVSVPYFFCNDSLIVVAARQLVLNEMTGNMCAYLTIRDPELGPVVGTRRNPFLFKRKMPQHYFVHVSLREHIPAGGLIHDGDGDCAFT